FVITIGTEQIRVGQKVLVAGTTNRFTYSQLTRGYNSPPVAASHTAGDAVSWSLTPRRDLLGALTSAVTTTTATSITVTEEKFGAPPLPFFVQVDEEQMQVTAR